MNDIYPQIPNREIYLPDKKLTMLVDEVEKERQTVSGRGSMRGSFANYEARKSQRETVRGSIMSRYTQ